MSEIVYYDANPTVRDIMMRQFGQYGLDVVSVPKLEKCEEVLKRCVHPVIFIADMSRQPEYLRELQLIVPKYIHEPERCILTALQPPALAPYLTEKIEDCFFKHVVERPFRRLDFIQFFEEIIEPYLASSVSIRSRYPVSCVNSSVEQITGPVLLDEVDENLAKQVEVIVQSTSNAISLDKLQEDAASEAPVQRCANRMSRRSRTAPRDAAASTTNPPENASARLREPARFMREGSAPRREGSDPHSRVLPGRSRTMQGASAADEAVLEKSVQSGSSRPVPPAPRMPANPYVKKVEKTASDNIQDMNIQDDDEDECTLIVSSSLASGGIEPSSYSPSLLIQTGESFMCAGLEISWLKSLLKMSLIHQQRYTVVAKQRDDSFVIFIHNGRVDWVEKIIDSRIPDAADFLASVAHSEHLPVNALLSLVNRNGSLMDAFVSQGLECEAIKICQQHIQKNLQYLHSFEGRQAEGFHDIPARWLVLSKLRPLHDVDVVPYLFEELRENSDALIVPEIFQYTRFVTRTWRTPVNVSIPLNNEEIEVMKCMQTPVSLSDLSRTGMKCVAEILYRLVLFELADFVQ